MSEERSSAVVVVENSAAFEREVLRADKPVVVKFWASWCPPCMAIKSIFPNLAQEFEGRIQCVEIELTKQTVDLAEKYELECIPAHLFFHQGQLVFKLEGTPQGNSLEDVQATLRDIFNNFLQDMNKNSAH